MFKYDVTIYVESELGHVDYRVETEAALQDVVQQLISTMLLNKFFWVHPLEKPESAVIIAVDTISGIEVKPGILPLASREKVAKGRAHH